ncbi:hypothetical protein BGZ73_003722 [Actinomortierella ambigua]|nr:hypothetical protein BGZ73_003722 [Actinomortierella ambigua]
MPNSHILSPTTDPFNPFGAADSQQSYSSMSSLSFSTAWAQGGTTHSPCHRPSRPLTVIGASPRYSTAQSTTVDGSLYRSLWQHPAVAVPSYTTAPDAPFPAHQRNPTSNFSHVLSALLASRASGTTNGSSHFVEDIHHPSSATSTTTTVPRTLESNIGRVPRPEYQTFAPSSSSCSPYAHMNAIHMPAMEPVPSSMASFTPPFSTGGDHAMGPIITRDRRCIQREPGLTDPSLDLPVQDLSETNAISMTRRRRSSANNSTISRPTSSLSSSSFTSSHSQLLSTSPQSTSSLSSIASSPPKAPLDVEDMSHTVTGNPRRPLSQTSKGATVPNLQRRHRSCSVASSVASTDSAPSTNSFSSTAAVAVASSSPPAAGLLTSSKAGQQQQQRGKHSSLLPPHQHQQLQQQINYKTEYCTRYQESGGHCPFGDRCQFAHDASELQRRPRSLTYKTRPCWSGDACLYQQNHQRCIYLHGDETPEMFDSQRGISYAKVQQICAKKAMKQQQQQQQQQQTKPKTKNDQRLSMPAIPSPSMTSPPKNPLATAQREATATTTPAASFASPSPSARRRTQRSQTLPSMTPVEAAASAIPASILPGSGATQSQQNAQDQTTVALLPPLPPATTALQEQEKHQSDTTHHTNNGRVMSWLFTNQANQESQTSQEESSQSLGCSRRKPFVALSNLRTTAADDGNVADGSESTAESTGGPLPSFPQGYDLVSDASSSSRESTSRTSTTTTTSTSATTAATTQEPQQLQAFQKPTFLSRSNRWSKSGAKKACPPKALSLSSLAEEDSQSPARSAARLASPALALMHTLRTPTRPTATMTMPTAVGSHYAVLPVPCAAPVSYDPFSMKTMMPMIPMGGLGMAQPPLAQQVPPPLMNTNHHNKSMMMMTMNMTSGFSGATSMHSKTDRSLLFSPGTPLTDMIPVLGLEQLESWNDICFDD